MNIKNLRKFVITPFLLVTFLATLLGPLLVYVPTVDAFIPPPNTSSNCTAGTANCPLAGWESSTSIVYNGETFKETSGGGNSGSMTLTGTNYCPGGSGTGNQGKDSIVIGTGNSSGSDESYLNAGTASLITWTSTIVPTGAGINATSKTICAKPTKSTTIYMNLSLTQIKDGQGSFTAAPGPPAATQGDCPINDGSALQWVLCPIFLIGAGAIQQLNNIIAGFLYTPTDQIFTSQFEGAFNKFRDIGVALLVIAAMVMVISQAAGLEIFAAYTVRKALPRIVIAAIGMALAWPLLEFVVTFFNDIGSWAAQLILAAAAVPNSGSNFNIGDVITATMGSVLGLVAVGGALVILGWAWLLALVGTILLAILIGLLVLALRQLVILVCILIAPLAIAASILPGTQKLWTFWKDTMLTTLLMFPIIMAFLASGVAMSHIAGATSSTTMQLLSLIVYFAPYFMLPFAFKLAGGLMSTAYSAINGAHQGAFARLKKVRSEHGAQNIHKAMMGRRFQGNNALTKGFNARSGKFGAFMASGNKFKHLTNKDVRDEGEATHAELAMAEYGKEGSTMASQFRESMLQAQTFGSGSEARANMAKEFLYKYKKDSNGDYVLDASGNKIITNKAEADADAGRAIAAAQANGGFGVAQQRFAAHQLSAIGTGYDTEEQQMRAAARAANGNDAMLQNLVGDMRGASERAGRPDLKKSYMTQLALAKGEMAALAGTGNAPSAEMYTAANIEAGLNTDNTSLMRAKPAAIRNIGAALAEGANADQARKIAQAQFDLNTAAGRKNDKTVDTLTAELQGHVLAKVENMQQSKSWGPEINSISLDEKLQDAQPDIKKVSASVNPPPASTPSQPAGQSTIIYDKNNRPLRAVPAAPAPSPTPPTTPPINTVAQDAYRTASTGRSTYDQRLDPDQNKPPEPPTEE